MAYEFIQNSYNKFSCLLQVLPFHNLFFCLPNELLIYIYKYPIIYIIGFNQSYLVDQSFSSPSLSSLPFTTLMLSALLFLPMG